MRAHELLVGLGLPETDLYGLPDSGKRFPDGARYRVEIPSVEGPRVLEAVLDEAERREVQLHRVSQGSGVMLLTDAEILEMCAMAREAGLELSLFVGPRASWETGAASGSAAGVGRRAPRRGQDRLGDAREDVLRGVSLGLRGVLVADAGLLWVLRDLKKKGELPEDLVIKVSVQLSAANAAAVKAMEGLGAGTYNTPTDLSLAQLGAIRAVTDLPLDVSVEAPDDCGGFVRHYEIPHPAPPAPPLAQWAAIRAVTDLPLDVYVEAPDDFGGFVRHYEIPDLVRVASPVFVKFGLRNAPNIYPSGTHLEATAVALGRERVRRAEIGRSMLDRYFPEAETTKAGAVFPGIPMGNPAKEGA